VICFHSLNNWYLQQHPTDKAADRYSCDLLSFFEQLIFATTFDWVCSFAAELWFAFILWTTDICNNNSYYIISNSFVVICFHSLNNWYLQQLTHPSLQAARCCDLLSFFEQLIFATTLTGGNTIKTKLWFAFILWTTDICNNTPNGKELRHKLWFAFILWTTDICNNRILSGRATGRVVICFHSLNNWYLQQLATIVGIIVLSCDLLSFFEQLIFATTRWSNRNFKD